MRKLGVFVIILLAISAVAFADSSTGYSNVFTIDNRDRSFVNWSYNASVVGKGEIGPALQAFGFGVEGASVKAGLEQGCTRDYEIEQIGSQSILRIRPRDKRSLVFGYSVGGADVGFVGATAFSQGAKVGSAYGTSFQFPAPLTDSGQAVLASAMIISDAQKACRRLAPGTGAYASGLIDWLSGYLWRDYATAVGGDAFYTTETKAGECSLNLGPVQVYSQSAAGLNFGMRAYSEKDLRDSSLTRGIEASIGGTMSLPDWLTTAAGEGSLAVEWTNDASQKLQSLTCGISTDVSSGIPFTQTHTVEDYRIVFTPQHCGAIRTSMKDHFLSQLSSGTGVAKLTLSPVGQMATGVLQPAFETAIDRVGPLQFGKYVETRTLYEFSPEFELQAGLGLNIGWDLVLGVGTRHLSDTADLDISSGSITRTNSRSYTRLPSQWDGASGIADFHGQLFAKAGDAAKDAIAARLKSAGQWITDQASHVVNAVEGGAKVIGNGAEWLKTQSQGIRIKIRSWSPAIPMLTGAQPAYAPMASTVTASMPMVQYVPYRSSAVADTAGINEVRSTTSLQLMDTQPSSVITVVGDVHQVSVTDSSEAEITSYPSGSTQAEFSISNDMLSQSGYKSVDASRLCLYNYNTSDNTWHLVPSTQALDSVTGNTVLTASLEGPGQYAAGIVGPPTDTEPPSVTITSPANGATVSGTITINGTCDDDVGISSVSVSVGDVLNISPIVDAGTWSCDVDTCRLASGTKDLSAEVTDLSGKTSSSAIRITLGNVASDTIPSARRADSPYAAIGNVVVTGGTDAFTGFFYVQSQTSPFGIRVAPIAASVSSGDMVTVAGLPEVVDGEVILASADVSTSTKANPLPNATGVSHYYLGGGQWGIQPAYGYGSGVTNVGLLVRVWGRVTQVGPDYLYIDDGSRLIDGTLTGTDENVGVRVVCDPSEYSPGQYLSVTGINSCFTTTSAKIVPQVLTRSPDDLIAH